MAATERKQLTPREQAILAARLAAYESVEAKTPASYTWLEALQEYGKEIEQKQDKTKSVKGAR